MSKNVKKVVCLKQTGEALGDGDAPLAAERVQSEALRLQTAAKGLAEMGVAGLLVVPGGGNIMRGRSFPQDRAGYHLSKQADAIARQGTVINAGALGASLADLGVPSEVFIAPGMTTIDPSMRPTRFDLDKVNESFRHDKIVLVGGGIGEDGVTTDYAVVRYALMQMNAFVRYGLQAHPYKATGNVDGVYSADPTDPANAGDAQFLAEISASDALRMGVGVVDEPSLRALADYTPLAGMPDFGLRVYNLEHDIADVVRSENTSRPIGSLVLAGA